MKFKAPTTINGRNPHRHTAVFDANGNGSTTSNDGHSHKIYGFVLRVVNGHKHDITERMQIK